MDHIMRYQNEPEAKLIVLLGEVGGVEEYEVCAALQDGRITKPLVAWCIGTCASMFTSEVQFGHAGSCANSDRETATAKNRSLLNAGAHVPESFDTLDELIASVYNELVAVSMLYVSSTMELIQMITFWFCLNRLDKLFLSKKYHRQRCQWIIHGPVNWV